MRSESLVTDHAMALAQAILEMVAPCLREEEHKEAFGMFYEAAKAALESYETRMSRMVSRVKPSKN